MSHAKRLTDSPNGFKTGAATIRLAIATAMVLLLSVLVGAPAGADHAQQTNTCLPFPWESETQLSLLPFVSPNGKDCWRPVVWPGAGHLMTRPEVDGFRTHYDSQGYDQNFIWFAPQEQVRVADYATRSWTGCNHIPAGALQLCTSLNTSNLGADFNLAANPVLTVLRWQDDWIALVCGNNLVRNGSGTPIPTIPIEKFIDQNRNGVVDAGDVTSGPQVNDVDFEIWRVAKPGWVDDPLGYVTTLSTNSSGDAEFILDGHGPGTYEIREIVPGGSMATTPAVRTVQVDPGIGAHRFPVQRFGNAPKFVDVAKTQFDVTLPDNFEARTDGDVTVDVTITNNGPADHVPVTDEVVVTGPSDCVISPTRREFSAVLRVNQSTSRSFVFSVNCDRPSFHEFQFDDLLTIDDPRLMDTDPSNNTASRTRTRPVLAFTDLSTSTSVTCPPNTEVGVATNCAVVVDASNNGYGPIDATVDVELEQTFELGDCTIEPASLQYAATGLDDDETRSFESTVTVTCGYRSDHQITASGTVAADDIHVIDTNPANDVSAGSSEFEVFHDAVLTADNIALFCNETLSDPNFSCSADVTVNNAGPAPDVIALVTASIAGQADCAVSPLPTQSFPVVLAIGVPQTVTFNWDIVCTNGMMLHPFHFEADVSPDEPHAVDEPGVITDDWTVPFCMETVNPSGNNTPAAPGNGGQGQNQDGFYTFGAKTLSGPAEVWIEDDGTGTIFGPFPSGVRVKYIEANGATPSITPMGGNNGNGGGNGNGGNSVDYQIRGQGDALAVHFDEDGNKIQVSCLVPPFPQ